MLDAPTLTTNLIYTQAVLAASAWQEVQTVIKTKRHNSALLGSSYICSFMLPSIGKYIHTERSSMCNLCWGGKNTLSNTSARSQHSVSKVTQKNRRVYTSWRWQWWRKYNVNTSQHACKDFFSLILPMQKLMIKKNTFSTSEWPLGFTTVTVWCWTVICSHHMSSFFLYIFDSAPVVPQHLHLQAC